MPTNVITNMSTTRKLYLIQEKGYLKICLESTGGRNAGIMDRKGCISSKAGPLSIIGSVTGYRKATNGCSRTHSGTNYRGSVDFGTTAAARAWLSSNFDVRV